MAAGRSRDELNLNVLRRFDSDIQQILGSAAHVVLYDFDQENSKWEWKNIEGPLFVVMRSTEPHYQMVIMNKKSPDNFQEDITADFAFEINHPYIIYKNDQFEVIGIWFFEQGECEAMYQLIRQLQDSLRQTVAAPPPPAPAQPQAVTSHQGTGADLAQESANLMGMLKISPQQRTPLQVTSASKPALLTPDFFQRPPAEAQTPTAESSAQERGDNSLGKHFARMAAPTRAHPEALAGVERREKVRTAIQRLLENDQFLDLIVGELEAVGAL